IYHVGPLDARHTTTRVILAGSTIDVTPTEFVVLQELLREPGRVVSCAELVRSSQHITIDDEEARQVIRPHIVRLRRKIEPDPQQPCYIQSVRGIGYRWAGGLEQAAENTKHRAQSFGRSPRLPATVQTFPQPV
ncbi:winged helix-turn-helix transcriptional regulator, partial [Candidatus Gracilibacteria bacterium]|nr:winged helix-turn-helix transcriptional regulator [Candidatus Gracilibacteria bacterium]